jgi:hypothetical protein
VYSSSTSSRPIQRQLHSSTSQAFEIRVRSLNFTRKLPLLAICVLIEVETRLSHHQHHDLEQYLSACPPFGYITVQHLPFPRRRVANPAQFDENSSLCCPSPAAVATVPDRSASLSNTPVLARLRSGDFPFSLAVGAPAHLQQQHQASRGCYLDPQRFNRQLLLLAAFFHLLIIYHILQTSLLPQSSYSFDHYNTLSTLRRFKHSRLQH